MFMDNEEETVLSRFRKSLATALVVTAAFLACAFLVISLTTATARAETTHIPVPQLAASVTPSDLDLGGPFSRSNNSASLVEASGLNTDAASAVFGRERTTDSNPIAGQMVREAGLVATSPMSTASTSTTAEFLTGDERGFELPRVSGLADRRIVMGIIMVCFAVMAAAGLSLGRRSLKDMIQAEDRRRGF
ncbi:MAG TPA: hypothetical protein DIC56_09445 [Rhizobium sp.]|nr:hypothetical protein [Rhizobium sp.]